MSSGRLNLPNTITVGRILVCPAIFALAMQPTAQAGFAAFVLFVIAGLSDVWDGYLARKHGWITDVGKLLDPVADKLLLASTFIPFYLVSQRPGTGDDVPFVGPLPLWVLMVVFGRELAITIFRIYAARRGVVIAAGPSGKHKALVQSLFIGGLLLWYPLNAVAVGRGWTGEGAWSAWSVFHGGWVAVTLAIAILLTIYSMLDYLWSYRSLMGVRG